ncbi:MAG: cytoplasmic protein [Desulfobacca sp.]|nr:cytoplasmic protein [Desulfobacca sp.]
MDNRCNPPKTKFETFGEEMLEKVAKKNGYSCQIYLPPSWVGKHVKIIRIN